MEAVKYKVIVRTKRWISHILCICTFDRDQIIDTPHPWSVYGQISWPLEIVFVLWFVMFFLLDTWLVFITQTIVVLVYINFDSWLWNDRNCNCVILIMAEGSYKLILCGQAAFFHFSLWCKEKWKMVLPHETSYKSSYSIWMFYPLKNWSGIFWCTFKETYAKGVSLLIL